MPRKCGRLVRGPSEMQQSRSSLISHEQPCSAEHSFVHSCKSLRLHLTLGVPLSPCGAEKRSILCSQLPMQASCDISIPRLASYELTELANMFTGPHPGATGPREKTEDQAHGQNWLEITQPQRFLGLGQVLHSNPCIDHHGPSCRLI